MGEVFNYDDRVFDIIDKNKELMRMKDVINNILKSPEIKKILEKASKGGFGLDEDDKDFSKMIVDNNYEINTILDAYMQEISVRERPPLPRDLVLDSARRSIGEEEQERPQTLEDKPLVMEEAGEQGNPSTEQAEEAEEARKRLLEEQESAQRLEPTQAETDPSPEEPGVPEEQAGRHSETTTVVTASGFKKPPAITEAYRRPGRGKEEPEQPRGDRTDDGKKNNGG